MHRVRRSNLFVPDAEADIYVVGLGIGGYERRTVEADAVLAESEFIFHLTAFDAQLRETYPNSMVIDHGHLYSEFDDPSFVYNEMAEAVVKVFLSRSTSRPVSFLVYGHPAVLVDSATIIKRQAEKLGIRVKTVPGISFIDESISLFDDRLDRVTQHYEATYFVRNRIAPDTRYPVLLSQVGDFDSRKLRPQYDSDRFSDLYDYISELYSFDASRRIDFFLLPWREDMEPQVVSYQISNIRQARPFVGNSLLIHGTI
ncbi:SAM-dependent methyltransferase [Trueperella pyogenes]|uniref:SAM-dependent methyltransferase n=1 Tax=Trueperella pyogenes TaxID=1661 RepID=UPI000F857C07|nr:SAM-dependent methyltransferase [Trueperella pyogenes]AZR02344.1 hypothetical protein EB775_02865 [Trueperella pyogenes]MCI7689203.1 SAM-dependent methyltransferase [Trueperella pyogenes]